ncbi:hypothetical protein [Arundinibacter roseus]|uniref:DUF4332 domain-containing protein n=1 Tax=Arundinibacter roseus TaxID=2070510 RepID=A0A4R4KMI8_9BACT|nr:hypothetical protein [Arundinibacter roseus]TDB68212.1 hypothetical protein EZE20_04635 [Arundinibacter roseus]
MIFLQLNPLSGPVAITEMVLLLAGTALIGWLLGRWVMAARLDALRESIEERTGELDFCRSTHATKVNTFQSARLKTAPSINFAQTNIQPDDLKMIEGIGTAIEALLNANGFQTFADLAEAKPEYLAGILKNAGSRFQMHDPGTWPTQAALARDQNWVALEEMQRNLKAGRI